jgi:photosystem II stability/assembly factor-like uncharacterized protein
MLRVPGAAIVLAVVLMVSALDTVAPSVVGGRATGEDDEYLRSLAMDAEGRTLFLGAHFGFFRSDNGGHRWRRVVMLDRPHLDVLAIAADPKDFGTIYVGTHEAGVSRSTDHGKTWLEVNSGLGGLDVHGLAIDPKDSRTLYAAVLGIGQGIYQRNDPPGTWFRIAAAPPGEVRVLAAVGTPAGTALYAGSTEGLQTADAAGKWVPVRGVPGKRMVRALVVVPGDAKAVYVVLEDALFLSTDAGRVWNARGRVIKNLAAITANAKRPDELYAVSNDGAFFKSIDGGITWEQLKGGTSTDEMKG